jgi:alpha-glucosidase
VAQHTELPTELRLPPGDPRVPWWRDAVVYQVYPRSFADGDGNGVGDLRGIRSRLDHIRDLGVDAIWISPVFRSPMADAGYDISDYTDIDPIFGDLAEMDALITEAHARDVRVLLDFVPNHTSDRHPWFIESRSSRVNPKRDWYIWRDEPNNWRSALGSGSAWTWDEGTGQYYLHLFLPAQPDLNWRNPEVVEAMHGVLRFWLDRGIDGFRIDVVHCIGKDPSFADDHRCAAGEPLSRFNDQPYTHELLRGIRRLVDSYPGDRVIVGEVNIRSTRSVAQYYGSDDELHMSFNFPPLDAPWDPIVWRMCVREVEQELSVMSAWPTWVLSNHDNPRHRTRYGGSLRRARAAAVLLLTLRGTPFVYQGEELGLEDAAVSPDEQVDPGGRDGSRAPIPWLEAEGHGWNADATWLPFPPDAAELSAERQRSDPRSMLRLYRRLLHERRRSAALRGGGFEEQESPPEVLAYRRASGDDERLVAVNFADHERSWQPAGTWSVVVSSYGGSDGNIDGSTDRKPYAGVLGPEQAVLLERKA